MIDLKTLEQLVIFSHTGTLCETAKKLHISQSTLTRGMQKLESEFGVCLFIRTKNSLSLTEAGTLAAAEAEVFLRQYAGMLRHVQDFDRKKRTVSIGSCAPVPISVLVQRITVACPDTSISTELKKIPQLLYGLEDDTYQLIILPFPPENDQLSFQKLCEEQLFFYLHKNHRFAGRKSLHVREMNGENMLSLRDIGFWHDLVTEKMPDSRFFIQAETYPFQELIANSTISVFTTVAYPDTPPDTASPSLNETKPEAPSGHENSGMERVRVPIADPEFHVTYYVVYKKENGKRFHAFSS